MDRDSEQMEVGRAEVFSIPGPCLTDVNYSNDQQGRRAHPATHPLWMQARTQYYLRGREEGHADVERGEGKGLDGQE